MATKPSTSAPAATVSSRHGSVHFEGGAYVRAHGTAGWSVQPIPGFGQPVGPPLGLVRIVLSPPMPCPYTVIATALRLPTTPLLSVNCGEQAPEGFVIHLFEPVSTQTIQNGGFSFLVLPSETHS